MKKFVKIGIAVVALTITAGSIWLAFATRKANHLVDQANAAVDTGNEFAKQAGAKYAEVFTESNLAGFPGNRQQVAAPSAQDVADLLGKAADQFDLAATTFDAASHEGAAKVLSDYWSLGSQQFHKFAESKRTFRAVALLISDENVSSLEAFNEKSSPLIDAAMKLNAESNELGAQAER